MEDNGPQTEYERRRADRLDRLNQMARRCARLADARGGVFLIAAGLAVYAFRSEVVPLTVVLVPAVLFIVLVVVHHRCERTRGRLARAVAYYERGLRRLGDRWRGDGDPGMRYVGRQHLYADDLDLFGDGSLFELLSTARTRMGEDTLAAWLRRPATPDEIRARQAALVELRDRLDLREDLGTLPEKVGQRLDPAVLRGWIGREPQLTGHLARYGGFALPALLAIVAVPWLAGTLSFGIAGLVFAVELCGWYLMRQRILAVVRIAEGMARHLELLSQVLRRLEEESFASEKLAGLHRRLRAVRRWPPHAEVARLRRLVDAYDTWTRNMLLVPVAVALLLPLHIALAMERWRRSVGPHAVDWLAVVGQIEALLALAGYLYERPGDLLPEIVEAGPLLDAQGLGHPLLPEAACVRNDVALDASRQMLLVSGSNMSGKSTMLRTVGVNVVLALAGAPVRAKRLRVAPVAIAATINIRDSLQEGQSHFYAEMARLRDVVGLLAGELPVLFLFDEIMHGTNSHDRRIGAEAVLRKLLDGGAIGLITTHDLALAEIVEALGPRADNAHFQDELVNGRMTFDYRMRPGVVQKSNALDVMRSLGLDV